MPKIPMINKHDLKRLLTPRNAVILIFAIYFLVGLLIVGDYGLSTDEPMERRTSLVNYVYVMERFMIASEHETVQEVLHGTPYIMEWSDRFYGVALQTLTVLVEHARRFDMTYQEIFVMRHTFTFINFFIGGIFFYLILRRRFGDTWLPVVGALFYILYPRFFGESFFNIKDILFFSWCVISSYFVLRWLEDDDKQAFILPAAITLAVATNTRVLGISILLLACGFAFIQGLVKPGQLRYHVRKCAHLMLLTFASYVVITPFTWSNPIKNTIDTFFHFLWFQPWNSTHFYLGEMITREVPWHYIPVWMGVTVPVLYIVLFLVGFVLIVANWVKTGKGHMYDWFFFAMFVCTLLGFIYLRISMYEGWRHAYSIFLPFLFISVNGLYRAYKFLSAKGKIPRFGFMGVVAASLVYLLVWIVMSHPYQYVYFNIASRRVAARYFAVDYWYVSTADMARYALARTDEPFFIMGTGAHSYNFNHILPEEDRQRFVFASYYLADFYIRGSRIEYEARAVVPHGFAEISSIWVDGMRIATLYERLMPFTFTVDTDAWNNVARLDSNANHHFSLLHDGDFTTRWTTHRPQEPGDYLLIEFYEPVDFNYIRLLQGRYAYDYPRGLGIFTSSDGAHWQRAPIIGNVFNGHFAIETEEYRFIRFVITEYSYLHNWSIVDLRFGHITS